MGSPKEINAILNRLLKDNVLNILVRNSNLTPTQLETLIIDFLLEINYIEKANYDLKGLFRLKRVSRGSFHRTLHQARKNIVSSLFTILLMIYIGIFDEAVLNEFKLLAERLKEYLSLARAINSVEDREALKAVEEELINGLKKFAEAKSPSVLM